MAYCTNCGEKIEEEAYFCPKCGTKTARGKSANAVYPMSELREALNSVTTDLEKALNMAMRETHSAIQKAKENLQSKPAQSNAVICSKCSASSPSGSVFCNACGSKLASAETPSGSA